MVRADVGDGMAGQGIASAISAGRGAVYEQSPVVPLCTDQKRHTHRICDGCGRCEAGRHRVGGRMLCARCFADWDEGRR